MIHPLTAIPTKPNGGNHTALFAASASTEEAHKATVVIVKALAHVGFRVIDDDEFFTKVSILSFWSEFSAGFLMLACQMKASFEKQKNT